MKDQEDSAHSYFLHPESRALYSICPDQVVRLTRDLGCLGPKVTFYSFYHFKEMNGCVKLAQPEVEPSTCIAIVRRAEIALEISLKVSKNV